MPIARASLNIFVRRKTSNTVLIPSSGVTFNASAQRGCRLGMVSPSMGLYPGDSILKGGVLYK